MDIHKELSKRIEDRLKALNIEKSRLDKEIIDLIDRTKKEEYKLSYPELKKLSDALYIDPFLLVSKSYKSLHIKVKNLTDDIKPQIKALEKIAYLLIREANFPSKHISVIVKNVNFEVLTLIIDDYTFTFINYMSFINDPHQYIANKIFSKILKKKKIPIGLNKKIKKYILL